MCANQEISVGEKAQELPRHDPRCPPRVWAKWDLEDTEKFELGMEYSAAGDMAETFHVDISKINPAKWDPTTPLQTCMNGPKSLQGKWNWSFVVEGLGPGVYSKPANAVAAINSTTMDNYPSRKQVYIKNQDVSFVIIYMDN